jgi:hypothetical protein
VIKTLAVVGKLILASTILLAGWHTVYYLYNWQWARAQIAGIAFIATLVIGAAWFLLTRMDRLQRDIDRRLAEMEAVVSGRHTAVGASSNRVVGSPPDFSWLDPAFSPPHRQSLLLPAAAVGLAGGSPRISVFIPILLGAGLVLSIVAGLVERAAAALHPPAETGVEAGGHPNRAEAESTRSGDRTAAGLASRRGWSGLVARGVIVVALVIAGTAGIYQTVHYRPDSLGVGTTELTVQVLAKAQFRPPAETVETMARYCARTAITGVSFERVEPVSATTALLVVSPLLDEEAQRRYGGCLEDVSLSWHKLTVTKAVLVPARTQP